MANTEKKLTKKDFYNALLNFIQGEDTIDGIDREKVDEFINHELELLNRKKASSTKTAKQTENEGYKQMILATLVGVPMSITDILDANEELATAVNRSNQKISALLAQMYKGDNPSVIRTETKGKATFALNPDYVEGE